MGFLHGNVQQVQNNNKTNKSNGNEVAEQNIQDKITLYDIFSITRDFVGNKFSRPT